MSNLFENEELFLSEIKLYIDNLGDNPFVERERFIELYNSFSRFVRQTKRTMRISDRMAGELNSQKLILADKAYIDELTGAYNRRYMNMAFESLLISSIRNGRYISVFMMDIDFFKKYNDTYGHQAGDVCLSKVSSALSAALHRTSDVLIRYGGEEFMVLLPDTDKNGAFNIAENMMKNIRELDILHEKNEAARHVTISAGITSVIPKPVNTVEQLIKTADTALYEAKHNGRNQYVFKEPEGSKNDA